MLPGKWGFLDDCVYGCRCDLAVKIFSSLLVQIFLCLISTRPSQTEDYIQTETREDALRV